MNMPLALPPLEALRAPVLQAPQAQGRGPSTTALDRAAREFEALFAAQMLKPMFEGLSADGPFGGGQAETMWRGIMLEKLGERIAEAGGLGLADAVRAALVEAGGVVDVSAGETKESAE